MTPKLNSELSDAVRNHAGPLEVEDAAGEHRYIIVDHEEYRALVGGEIRRWLQVGLDQESRGESAEWNTEEILAERGGDEFAVRPVAGTVPVPSAALGLEHRYVANAADGTRSVPATMASAAWALKHRYVANTADGTRSVPAT